MLSECYKNHHDRYLAKKIANIIGETGISTEAIITSIKAKQTEISEFLEEYPSYFSTYLERI